MPIGATKVERCFSAASMKIAHLNEYTAADRGTGTKPSANSQRSWEGGGNDSSGGHGTQQLCKDEKCSLDQRYSTDESHRNSDL